MTKITNIGDHVDGEHITVGQAQKEVSSNALDDLISDATQKPISIAITDSAGSPTSADRTLTDDEFFGDRSFKLTGSPTIAFALILPATGNHEFVVINETGQTCTVRMPSGGTTVTVPDDAVYVLFSDGTDVDQRTGNKGTIYDFGFAFGTTPTEGKTIQAVRIGRTIVIPANFAGAAGGVVTNPNEPWDIDVLDDGASIGTISVSTIGVVTFTTVGGVQKQIAAGNEITFVAPTTSPSEATVEGGSFVVLATVR